MLLTIPRSCVRKVTSRGQSLRPFLEYLGIVGDQRSVVCPSDLR